MQSESTHHHEQNPHDQEQQEQVVVFKFKRAFHQESYDQIKIHSKKVKPNPENVEKASVNYKKRNFIDRQTMLANLFQKLQLNPKKQPQSPQNYEQNPITTQKPSKQQPSHTSKLFFLKKVEFNQIPNTNQHFSTTQPNDNQIRSHMKQIKSHARKHDLQEKLNKLRNLDKSSEKAKRIKYKIIDIKQQNFVDFGGQKYEYQDLSKQYSPNEKLSSNVKYDYYVLKRGQILSRGQSIVPQIILPQQAQYLLEDYNDQQMQAQIPQDSSSDSNRQDRSDYEYPQEDYHEGDSDKQSEDIISGDKQKSQNESDNDNLNNSYREQDEEEYYRQYLKRCKKQQQGDDQLTYLYNFKSKYQDESDY